LVARDQEGFLIDASGRVAPDLLRRLSLYRLRSRVGLSHRSDLRVVWSRDSAGEGFMADPRREGAGGRCFAEAGQSAAPSAEWERVRLALGLPEGGRDFAYGEVFPHEANMDRLHGVSFQKGCYVGQEVVSRMQHRGLTRSRVLRVSVEGPAPEPFAEIRAGETLIGRMGSSFEGAGLAMMRLDRLEEAIAAGRPLLCAGAALRLLPPTD
jgi:hypothetical protein